MFTKTLPWVFIAVVTAVCSCSVVSRPVKSTALTGVPFPALLSEPELYRGQPVVLAGYLLNTENLETVTVLSVLQAPLGARDEPGSRDGSQGRFQVTWSGFLDPELYKKGGRVTVAGTVSGRGMRRVGNTLIPYLQIRGTEIHLWPPPKSVYYAPYYYDGWYEPFYWRRPFYHRRPYHPYRPHRPHRPRPPRARPH